MRRLPASVAWPTYTGCRARWRVCSNARSTGYSNHACNLDHSWPLRWRFSMLQSNRTLPYAVRITVNFHVSTTMDNSLNIPIQRNVAGMTLSGRERHWCGGNPAEIQWEDWTGFGNLGLTNLTQQTLPASGIERTKESGIKQQLPRIKREKYTRKGDATSSCSKQPSLKSDTFRLDTL